MYKLLSILTLAAVFSFIAPSNEIAVKKSNSIFKFKVESLDGGQINFKNFKGKKILVVNTA